MTGAAVMTGTVLGAISGFYDVRADDAEGPPVFRCRLRDRLRKQFVRSQSGGRPQRVQQVRRLAVLEPVVVGDRVRFRPEASSGTSLPEGVIEEVLPRTGALARQAVTDGDAVVGQILAANLDQVVVVFAAACPGPTLGLLDRLLVSCEAAALPALICINKCDLGIGEALAGALGAYERAGYRVVRTSAAAGGTGVRQGLDALRAAVGGKVSAVVGPSGVGKTTLLNALMPGLGLRVAEISASTGKGKHTTRHAQLIPLPGGGGIADTPGLRQLALWDVPADRLDRLFPEFRLHLDHCRFRNCAHVTDEGCAVMDAVARGEIDRRRYHSYVKLFLGT